MKIYKLLLASFICINSWNSYAKINLKEFACTIADTTQSEADQVKSIYVWITSNISYDLKSYLNLSPKNLLPEQTLKTKRGLCYEYAGLMTSLCNSIGIEAYTISGYSKGYKYYSGKVFLHSDHCWNIIKTESDWIIADPTWGSGYINYKTGIFSSIKQSIGFNSVIKQKPVFITQNNPDFFDISSDQLLRTHYPLDPKWLLENNPPSYTAFESGYTDSSLIIVDWVKEINNVKGKSQSYIFVSEGETATHYNQNNLFDAGMALFSSMSEFDVQKSITKENDDLFLEINKKLEKVINLLLKQRIITDSLYKQRFISLKEFNAAHSRANKAIENEAISSTENFKKNKSSHSKKSKDIYLKIAELERKIEVLHETHLKESKAKMVIPPDPAKAREAKIALFDTEMRQSTYNLRLDSLNAVMDNLLTIDAILNDSIVLLYNELIIEKRFFHQILLAGDEGHIRNRSDSVLNKYTQCSFLTERKKINSIQIEATASSFRDNRNKWLELLKEEQSQLKEMYKSNTLPEAVYDVYEYSLSENISLYESQIEFENRLLTHLGLQEGFIMLTLKELKSLQKITRLENKQFTEWFGTTIQWEKVNYKNDSERIMFILKEAAKKKKIIDKKMLLINKSER